MKYYIDCGGHFGEGLKSFIDMYKIDETWTIVSFEPNIESFEKLKKFNYNDCKIKFINKGVWIENKKMLFRPEKTTKSYGGRNDGSGSTFISNDDWNIKTADNKGAGDFLDSYEVDVIDFDYFLKSLEDVEFLLVKMDIEGSEYSILRKLIETGTISLIDQLYVEFHDWAMSTESKDSTALLIETIKNKGVDIKKWV